MTSSSRPARGGPSRPDPSFVSFRPDPAKGDATLSACLSRELLLSPSDAADLIDFGSVQVDGRQERDPARTLEGVEEIRVWRPWEGPNRHYELNPARILYRDRVLIACDKEPGIPSQQTPSDAYNNLYAAVQRRLALEGVKDPYVALHHRLDRETSGVMIFALDRSANRRLGEAFERRKISKEYLAWVGGVPEREEWTSNEDIGRSGGRYVACARGQGKPAETLFRVLHADDDRTLVLARPRTGRTHQVRLHLQAAGHPILGDRLYGGQNAPRLYLHAWALSLNHPATGRVLTVRAPLAPEWPQPHPQPNPG